jgi:predicted NodU family carbamoyl transferase
VSQLILSVHSGNYDAVAAVFQDYELRAAAQLERLTRRKSDGREHPDLASNVKPELRQRIAAVVHIDGWARRFHCDDARYPRARVIHARQQ